MQKRSDSDSTAAKAQHEPQCPCTSEKGNTCVLCGAVKIAKSAMGTYLPDLLIENYNQTEHALENEKDVSIRYTIRSTIVGIGYTDQVSFQ